MVAILMASYTTSGDTIFKPSCGARMKLEADC